MSFLKKIDFLSSPVNIRFRGETSVKSLFGVLMSILFVTLATVLLLVLGRELVARKNPLTSSSDIQAEETIIYVKDFPIAFYIQGSRGEDITEQVFKTDLIRATIFSTALSGQTANPRSLILSECTQEVAGIHYSLLESIKRTKFCINPFKSVDLVSGVELEEEIFFSKGFLEAGSESITISILKGENFIPGHDFFYFSLLTVENILDERDYGSPLKTTLSNVNRQFDTSSQLKLEPVIQANKLVTDRGWLTAEEEEESYFSNMFMKELIRPIEGRSKDALIRVELTSSQVRRERYREYLKIPGLLANFGGAVKILQFVFFGVMKIYSEFILFDYVWNHKKEAKKSGSRGFERRNREEYKGNLNLKDFLKWKLLFCKPNFKIVQAERSLELSKIMDKGSLRENTVVSRLKINLSSNHLMDR